MEEIYMQKTNFKTLDLCMIGVVTAVIVIMAQISIPMPLGVPMTMQTFAITLAGIILGSKKGAVASLIYVLLGAVGVPVFANFSGVSTFGRSNRWFYHLISNYGIHYRTWR